MTFVWRLATFLICTLIGSMHRLGQRIGLDARTGQARIDQSGKELR
jgi:hypothetical protein